MSKFLLFWILVGFAQNLFGFGIVSNPIGNVYKSIIQNIRNQTMLIDVNKLLKKEFKNDDKVVIIHDDTTSGEGKLHYGRLRLCKRYCIVGSKRFPWKHVIFMSQDGFPCRTMDINMSTEQLNDIENEETLLLMRKVLADEKEQENARKIAEKEKAQARKIAEKEKAQAKERVKEAKNPIHYYGGGGGCPFVFDDVQMQILNSGIVVPQYVETLVMTAKDGAKGFMWDIDNEIFDFWKN